MSHIFKRTENIEVTSFPHFRKYGFFYYKVLNETHEIRVSYLPDGELESAEIGYDKICVGNTFIKDSYEITEEEFNETFKRATELINKMLGFQNS